MYTTHTMKTVNISLPESLATQIDMLLGQKEYSSRSEVVRTALRVFFTFQKSSSDVELIPFKKRPVDEVKKEMITAGHSKEFVSSVIHGLEKSSIYKNK